VRSAAQTILVVDNEPSIRLLCRVNLEFEGYRVLEAATLSEARRQIHAADVVLLDVHLGNEDGTTLLRELRDDENRIPVALLTGSVGTPAGGARGLADAIVAKPFTLEGLTGTVRDLLDVGSTIR